jgi:hypothetical protein
MSKKVCYNYDKNRHFITQYPYERKEENNDKRNKFSNDTKKIRNTLKRSLMVKPMLTKNGTQVMRVPSQKVMRWQP